MACIPQVNKRGRTLWSIIGLNPNQSSSQECSMLFEGSSMRRTTSTRRRSGPVMANTLVPFYRKARLRVSVVFQQRVNESVAAEAAPSNPRALLPTVGILLGDRNSALEDCGNVVGQLRLSW